MNMIGDPRKKFGRLNGLQSHKLITILQEFPLKDLKLLTVDQLTTLLRTPEYMDMPDLSSACVDHRLKMIADERKQDAEKAQQAKLASKLAAKVAAVSAASPAPVTVQPLLPTEGRTPMQLQPGLTAVSYYKDFASHKELYSMVRQVARVLQNLIVELCGKASASEDLAAIINPPPPPVAKKA